MKNIKKLLKQIKDESNGIENEINNLDVFIYSKWFSKLPTKEKYLILRQKQNMIIKHITLYSKILAIQNIKF